MLILGLLLPYYVVVFVGELVVFVCTYDCSKQKTRSTDDLFDN